MAIQYKFRSGTTAQHSTFTGAAGEITVDTDKNLLVVHDGVTAGGIETVDLSTITSFTAVVDDTTPQLGGNLDVNGNTITSVSNGDVTIEPNGSGTIRLSAADVLVNQDIVHAGDTNNKIVFGTLTQDYQTGGSSRLDISTSGVRLGGSGARVTTILDQDTMSSNSDTALVTQQSFKAYADSTLVGGGTNDIVLLSHTTASGASTVDFSFDDATYPNIYLVAQNIVMSADSAIYIRTSTDGGSTYDSGASDYMYHYYTLRSAADSYTAAGSTSAAQIVILSTVGSATNETGGFNLHLFDADDTNSRTAMEGQVTCIDAAGELVGHIFMALRKSTGDVDGIQVLPASGTISGDFYLYGLKDA